MFKSIAAVILALATAIFYLQLMKQAGKNSMSVSRKPTEEEMKRGTLLLGIYFLLFYSLYAHY